MLHIISVPPETPIRDVVDRCRVWESHADAEIRRVSKPNPEPTNPTYAVNDSEHGAEAVRVVTVNKPNNSLDQVEELLKRLLAGLTPATPNPTEAPETPAIDKLLQLLISETQKRQPAPQAPADSMGLETMLRTYFAEQQPSRQQPRPRPARRGWIDMKCFSCGKSGHGQTVAQPWMSHFRLYYQAGFLMIRLEWLQIAVGGKMTTDPKGGVRLSDQ